jgi:hypothetical protein
MHFLGILLMSDFTTGQWGRSWYYAIPYQQFYMDWLLGHFLDIE